MYLTVQNKIFIIYIDSYYILEAVNKYPVIDRNLIVKFEPYLEHFISRVSIKNILLY